jgi:hypothetical protein
MPRVSDRLSAEKRKLQEMEAELKRQEERLKKQLKVLPAQLKAKKEKLQEKRREELRHLKRIDLVTTSQAELIARLHHRHDINDHPTAMMRHNLRKVRREEKIKFLVLGMILVLVLLMLWRAMPS